MKSKPASGLPAFLPAFLAALCPGAALACALPPSLVLTLPTGHYIAGAGATVAITAGLGATTRAIPELRAATIARLPALPLALIGSYLSFLLLMALILIGFTGAPDPMHNLLTLIFWTGVWVALPLVSMLFGNIWALINPWRAPVRMVRVLLGWQGRVGLSGLSHWPAVLGLGGLLWFELVSLSPEDPPTLALAALLYWLVIFALALAEGEDWLDRGEFLTLFMALIARVSPFWLEQRDGRAEVHLGLPGAQVLRMPAADASLIAFVTLALAGMTFDGVSRSFWWLALIGENPLEFTGRSAVIGVNSLGLIACWVLTALAILAALRLGERLGGAALAPCPVMLSFLAIAAGYHLAHYLPMLLTAGQFTLSALNDPFFRGDAFLGLEPFYVSFGFLADPRLSAALYAVQFFAILGAHLLAVLLALKLSGPGRGAMSHLPMTVLMTLYTVLGLWLLSTAKGI